MNINLTDEQFEYLWERFGYDDNLIAEVVKEELFKIHVPNRTGRTQSGVRVYYDDGFMGSGYMLVHWDDAKKLTWCQNNGYFDRLPENEQPVIWDDQPDREKALSLKKTMWAWAY